MTEFENALKLATLRGSLIELTALMLDIINKIIVQDIGAKSELSTRKYKPMMALDDEVEPNWANYIFSRLLENVRRNNLVQTSHI